MSLRTIFQVGIVAALAFMLCAGGPLRGAAVPAPASVLPAAGFDSKADVPMQVGLQFLSTPRLGAPVGLRATVRPLIDAPRLTVTFQLPDGVELVSGELTWSGALAAEQERAFDIRVKPARPGDGEVRVEALAEGDGYQFGRPASLYLQVSEAGVQVGGAAPAVEVSAELASGPAEPDARAEPTADSAGGAAQLYKLPEDQPQAAPLDPDALANVTINGRWMYHTPQGDQPASYAWVELWDDCEGVGCSGDILLWEGRAGWDGRYSVTINNVDSGGTPLDVYSKALSTDKYTVRVTTLGGGLYLAQTSTYSNIADGSFSFPDWTVYAPAHGHPFYILDKIADDAWNKLYNTVGWNSNFDLQVRWQSDSADGTHYHWGGSIDLLAGDGWDEDVFLHEYAHFVMWKIYGDSIPPSPNCNPHSWGVHSSTGCAWTEGWANFLQGAIQDQPNYVDTDDASLKFTLEPPTPASTHDSDEGSIAAILWDIYDPANESWDALPLGLNGPSSHGIWYIASVLRPQIFQDFWNDWASLGNGYCPQLWAVTNHVGINYDTAAPTYVTNLSSPSHAIASWSTDNTIDMTWTAPSETCGSGVGYSVVWDFSAGTTPNSSIDTTNLSSTSGGFGDSHNIYFHIKAVDQAGNVSLYTTHIGPYYVDRTPPTNPASLSSLSHTVGVWSTDPTIEMGWSGDADAGAGIRGYSILYNQVAGTLPDTILDTGAMTITSPSLTTGVWYFHLRTVDWAGNWSSGAVHAGPYYVDVNPPAAPSSATPGCIATSDVWQKTCRDPAFKWPAVTDVGSGTQGYYVYWGASAGGTSSTFTTTPAYDPIAVRGAATLYLRVQTMDKAGQKSAWTTLFILRYDASAPTNPTVSSPSHTPLAWSTDSTVDVTWSGASDGTGSGVYGYSFLWSTGSTDLPDAVADTAGGSATSPVWSAADNLYFHIRTRDNLGNWNSTAVHYGPFYIDLNSPTASMTALPAKTPGRYLNIHWAGNDPYPGSGVAGYDVQYRVGAGGAWTNWFYNTTQTSAKFGDGGPVVLVSGQTYYFRARTRDGVGYTSVYPSGDGHTFTTFLTGDFLFVPLARR